MIHLLMSGLPGRMAMAVAEEAVGAADIELGAVALSDGEGNIAVENQSVDLVGPEARDRFLEAFHARPGTIVVDYTHPSAVEGNVKFYTDHNIPFVLGTTGGDYDAVESMVVESKTPAVVAPNMGLPIVAITAMLEWAAQKFPGVFSGYDLEVRESHQKGKADTSGTAKDLMARFQRMGASFDEKDLSMCRDADEQRKAWGIPEEHLMGHAFHTYDLKGNDGTAHFSLSHNILGRKIYARGTLDALRFLSQRLDGPVERSYNMIDVLEHLQDR